MKIYLAAPIVNTTEEQKRTTDAVYQQLCETIGSDNIYNPSMHVVPNARGMSATELSRCIFAIDVLAITDSDWVVVCDYGRHGTAGTAWEAGYAFGTNKKFLLSI